MGLALPEAVSPPLAGVVSSVAVTVYEVTGAPPSEAGGVNVTVAVPSPAVATTFVGGCGAVARS
jgi:hypothetical protein